MECIGWVHREKYLSDFVARTFAHSARFAPSFVRQPNGPKCTQMFETHQNMSLGSYGVDRVRFREKFQFDFVVQTFALVRPVLP